MATDRRCCFLDNDFKLATRACDVSAGDPRGLPLGQHACHRNDGFDAVVDQTEPNLELRAVREFVKVCVPRTEIPTGPLLVLPAHPASRCGSSERGPCFPL